MASPSLTLVVTNVHILGLMLGFYNPYRSGYIAMSMACRTHDDGLLVSASSTSGQYHRLPGMSPFSFTRCRMAYWHPLYALVVAECGIRFKLGSCAAVCGFSYALKNCVRSRCTSLSLYCSRLPCLIVQVTEADVLTDE